MNLPTILTQVCFPEVILSDREDILLLVVGRKDGSLRQTHKCWWGRGRGKHYFAVYWQTKLNFSFGTVECQLLKLLLRSSYDFSHILKKDQGSLPYKELCRWGKNDTKGPRHTLLLKKNYDKLIHKTKTGIQTQRTNLWLPGGKWGRIVWEFGITRYTPLYRKWITSKD